MINDISLKNISKFVSNKVEIVNRSWITLYLIDNDSYLFVMEDLNQSEMVVFRGQITKGIDIQQYPNIGKDIGIMVANMLFKTSDLSMDVKNKLNRYKQ